MDDVPGKWAVFSVCCLFCFLSFAIRAAMVRLSWAKLGEMIASRTRKQGLEDALDNSAGVQTACTVIGVLCAAGAGVIIALEVAMRPEAASPDWGPNFFTAFPLAALMVLVFAWLLPSLVARRYAERIVLLTIPGLVSVAAVPKGLWRWAFTDRARAGKEIRPEVSLETHEDEEAGQAEEEAREIYRSALRFQTIDVSEIMTPRTDMVSVEDTNTLEEARAIVVECGHSRLPVFHDNRDNIVGVLYAKDLLQQQPNGNLTQTKVTEIMRKPYFVPETKVIDELLEEFQRRQVHVGVVLDEYGGTAGLVTVEDILEEIVGEIRDEFDQEEEATIRKLGDGVAELDARVHVEELNDAMGLDLPENGDFETVGGFISYTIGRIPRKDEQFRHGKARFTVLAADARKISHVRVEILRGNEKAG